MGRIFHWAARGCCQPCNAAQKLFGWISESVATEIAKALRVPLADVHGVIECYSLFYDEPSSRHVIRVCTDVACGLKGGDEILNHLCSRHGLKPGQTKPDLSLTIEASPCLGLCEHAPVALVDDQAKTNIDLVNEKFELGRPSSNVYGSIRILTANCGKGSTTSLAGYGKYSAFTKAQSANPDDAEATIAFGTTAVTVAVEHGNIFGLQCHPEKSQDAGLSVLDAFLSVVRERCTS